MHKGEFDFMEVKPVEAGWYFVTMYQYSKLDPKYPNYIKDWVEFDGINWDYFGYKDCAYVCFIHNKE